MPGSLYVWMIVLVVRDDVVSFHRLIFHAWIGSPISVRMIGTHGTMLIVFGCIFRMWLLVFVIEKLVDDMPIVFTPSVRFAAIV